MNIVRSDREKGLAALIEIVSDNEWSPRTAGDQAKMYVSGVRDDRIADVTYGAVELARLIKEM